MQYPVADAHCDFLYGMVNNGYRIDHPQGNQVTSILNFLRGGVILQFFACWIDTSLRIPPLHQCINMIEAFRRMLKDHPEELTELTPSFDPSCGKTACLLTIEGGEAIEGDLSVLRFLYDSGVRAMTMTWNEANELSGSAMHKNHRGLTELGKAVLSEMNRIGMAVDLAHLSEAGIDEVLSLSTAPVFASHSNARSVFESKRSLRDDQIKAISEKGGVVCVNFFNKQLTHNRVAEIGDIVRQILHVIKTGGIDCCGLGSDFDGMPIYPDGMPDASGYPALFSALRREGLSDEDILKISHRNLMAYIMKFV